MKVMMMMIAEKCRDGIVRHGCGVCSLIYLYVILRMYMYMSNVCVYVGGHACIYTVMLGWTNNLYCIYTHIYTHIHTHIHIYTYTHIHIYTYTHIHIYTYTHIHIYTYTHIYIYIGW